MAKGDVAESVVVKGVVVKGIVVKGVVVKGVVVKGIVAAAVGMPLSPSCPSRAFRAETVDVGVAAAPSIDGLTDWQTSVCCPAVGLMAIGLIAIGLTAVGLTLNGLTLNGLTLNGLTDEQTRFGLIAEVIGLIMVWESICCIRAC
ncbi:MAG TPA: hypothetical protein VGK74_19505 [Symbiobacteriaceae bacterium]